MKKGFIFIETIIVVTILTVALMSIYANYSKIISNTKEFNTFDTAEYNYKTYHLKQKYPVSSISLNTCTTKTSPFSDDGSVKICKLNNAFHKWSYLTTDDGYAKYTNIDAYIIDYLNNQDWNANNDNIYLVEYKKKDKQTNEYFTYISSLNY